MKDEFNPEKPKLSEQNFKGMLTLRGVTKPVEGKFSVGNKRDVSASFKIKLTDFNVEIPKYLGVTVADEVNIDVKIAELKVVK